ncbi:MAG: carbamoyl phosphate synthase small subunit, partial [Candidatus Omnitrophica bacterium]|nr:carbamoyl phosphate synthase small subunit [Candidatus Omnitrophota bacterium]
MKAILALEDGTTFKGNSFGASGECCGEVVFNTSMSGYQEIVTDPSYKGQIVTMTYPLIGNYGVNNDDVEACRPFAEGFVVREVSKLASNWRSQDSLDEYFKKNNVVGIEGIDTRALTLHIRQQGAMKAVITTQETDERKAVEIAQKSVGLVGRDLVKEVICNKPYEWSSQGKYKVVCLDCGIKLNMLRILAGLDCKVTVMPASASA